MAACLIVGVLDAPCDVPGALAVRRRPRVRVSNGYRREWYRRRWKYLGINDRRTGLRHIASGS